MPLLLLLLLSYCVVPIVINDVVVGCHCYCCIVCAVFALAIIINITRVPTYPCSPVNLLFCHQLFLFSLLMFCYCCCCCCCYSNCRCCCDLFCCRCCLFSYHCCCCFGIIIIVICWLLIKTCNNNLVKWEEPCDINLILFVCIRIFPLLLASFPFSKPSRCSFDGEGM